MMKKIVILFLVFVMLTGCAACGVSGDEKETAETETEIKTDMELQETQMKAICELAVMECYYHNVAKYFEEDAVKKWGGLVKEDKRFWIEYEGVVKLGIDVSQVGMTVDGTRVTVTMPEAEVLSCEVDSDSLSEDSFIVDGDSASIDAEDEIKALDTAREQLEEKIANDRVLLASAKDRVKTLLKEYITNIGNAIGVNYTITWQDVDADGNIIESTKTKTETETETKTETGTGTGTDESSSDSEEGTTE